MGKVGGYEPVGTLSLEPPANIERSALTPEEEQPLTPTALLPTRAKAPRPASHCIIRLRAVRCGAVHLYDRLDLTQPSSFLLYCVVRCTLHHLQVRLTCRPFLASIPVACQLIRGCAVARSARTIRPRFLSSISLFAEPIAAILSSPSSTAVFSDARPTSQVSQDPVDTPWRPFQNLAPPHYGLEPGWTNGSRRPSNATTSQNLS